jgi:hypothetical protein
LILITAVKALHYWTHEDDFNECHYEDLDWIFFSNFNKFCKAELKKKKRSRKKDFYFAEKNEVSFLMNRRYSGSY